MKLITFIDSIGRNIIGEELSSSENKISVKNPAMINVAQAQNERTITQIQATVTKLLFVHAQTHTTAHKTTNGCICDRTGESASITYVLEVEGSLGGDERLDATRVTSRGGSHKCSPSLRSARSSYTHPTVLDTHLLPHTPWRIHLA